jgi:hypothetical protein
MWRSLASGKCGTPARQHRFRGLSEEPMANNNNKDDLAPGREGERSKLEIRTILIVVVALIVLGAGYSLLFGSPTRNRAVADSPNTNPYPALNRGR